MSSKLTPNPYATAGAVQLRNAITERFGVELPATAALDFPTVLALAGYVAQSLAPATMQGALGALAAAVSLSAVWSEGSGKTGRQFQVCTVP